MRINLSPLNIQPKYFPIAFSSLLGPKRGWESFNICIGAPSKRQTQELMPEGISRAVPAGRHTAAGWSSGGCWRRQFQWEVARCPAEQSNRTNGASALPKVPFSWDSSSVLGLNVSQGLCQQVLVHQNSQWARETSKSYSSISELRLGSILPFPWQFCILPGLPSRTLPGNSGFLCIFGPIPNAI